MVGGSHPICLSSQVFLGSSVITQAVRHRVLKWARFVCLFVCFLILFFCGSTSGLMLIGWRAANMSSTSSGEERR